MLLLVAFLTLIIPSRMSSHDEQVLKSCAKFFKRHGPFVHVNYELSQTNVAKTKASVVAISP